MYILSLVDKETLLLEGLSDAKKAALDNFLNSYELKPKLQDTRADLLKKRSDFENIQDDLNRNQSNLSISINHFIAFVI